jgi:hypothetical protein
VVDIKDVVTLDEAAEDMVAGSAFYELVFKKVCGITDLPPCTKPKKKRKLRITCRSAQ